MRSTNRITWSVTGGLYNWLLYHSYSVLLENSLLLSTHPGGVQSVGQEVNGILGSRSRNIRHSRRQDVPQFLPDVLTVALRLWMTRQTMQCVAIHITLIINPRLKFIMYMYNFIQWTTLLWRKRKYRDISLILRK